MPDMEEKGDVPNGFQPATHADSELHVLMLEFWLASDAWPAFIISAESDSGGVIELERVLTDDSYGARN